MTRRSKPRVALIVGVLSGALLGGPSLGHAQVEVYDIVTEFQTALTAIQTIFMVANQVLELTGLDGFALDSDYSADLEALGAVVRDATHLSQDLSSLQAQVTTLFSLDTVPASATDLQLRLREIRRVTYETYVDALRTQTLVTTTIHTVQHLTQLLSDLENLVGNQQGNQTLAQLESKLVQIQTTMQVQTAAHQRAHAMERLAEPLTIESLHKVNESLLSDHPR
jgi:hypothetical protein